MSAFKDWITQEHARNANPSLEDAFWAGRRYLLGQDRHESCGMIYAKLDEEAREAKIRLAGVLHYLHEQEIISRSKMLQLSGMTVAELNRAIDELETCER
jgi:hypothetical protein